MAVTAVRLPMVNGNITKGNNSIECKKVILFRYYLLDILINISISIVSDCWTPDQRHAWSSPGCGCSYRGTAASGPAYRELRRRQPALRSRRDCAGCQLIARRTPAAAITS